jgi:Lipopolysaccharide-assembly
VRIAFLRNPTTSRARAIVLAVVFAISGCGYQFGASGSNLPPAAHTIYIARFTNPTRDTGLNDEFMVYLKDEIANHKRLEIVDSPSAADLELTGTMVNSVNLPNAFNSVLEPTQYAESIVIRAWLRDAHTNKIIWSTNGLGDTANVSVVSQTVVNTTPTFLQQNARSPDIRRMTDIQVAQSQTKTTREQGMANLAHRMYDAMASGF